MNRTELQGLKYALAAVALFFAIGFAGKCDYNEQVILHMSQGEYDSIVSKYESEHGKKPSENQIVKMYEENHR